MSKASGMTKAAGKRGASQTDRPGGADGVSDPSEAADAHELSTTLRIAVGRLSRRIRAEKASDELSDGQFSVLAFLHREGSQTVGSLAEYEHVTPPSMNRRVGFLIDSGFVSKENASDDGRKVMVSITAAGAAFVSETRRRREEWLCQRLEQLPEDQLELLSHAASVMREVADS